MTASVKPVPLKPASFADNLRFLRALIARPKKIGAITPSSPALGAAIARQIDPAAGPVLEVGPGTGVLTEAILARGVPPAALTLIEYDEDFARHNAARFPDVSVIQGDACQLEALLAPRDVGLFGAIVSGIPLLNFPTAWRQTYMQGLVARLKPGAPLIQFSYGTQAPVVPPPGHTVVRAAMVWSNIPPARVWVYRKA